jgi:uncharacterized protein YuzE/predicted DNA-binding transcriptional regulator AlpA
MDIAIQPDKENDSLYLAFGAKGLAKGSVAKSVRATADVTLDFDKDGRLVGLDVMNASDILMPDYVNVRLDALVGVKEAATLLGMQKSNFVRDVASHGDFPEPVAELATGRVWLRSQVEAFAASRKSRARKAS